MRKRENVNHEQTELAERLVKERERDDVRTREMGSGCVAQLVERSLPIPEVRGSNPVIGKNLFKLNICFLSTVY